MKPKFIHSALILATLWGCHSSQRSATSQPRSGQELGSSTLKAQTSVGGSENLTQWDELRPYLTLEKPSPNLVQTITGPCAVLVYPSEEQIHEMRKEYGNEDAETVGDDGSFYMSNVIQILKDLKIKTVVAKQRFIQIKGEKSFMIDIRKQEAPQFNLILCTPNKTPVFRVPIDVEKSFIENYFGPHPKPKQEQSEPGGKRA